MGTWSGVVIAADGTIYAADSMVGLVAFTPEGSMKWTAPFPDQSMTSTTLAIRGDGTVYVTWGYAALNQTMLYAVSPDGGVAWSSHAISTSLGMAVAGDGTVEGLGEDDHGSLVFGLVGPDGTTLSTVRGFSVDWMSPPALGPGGDLYSIGVGTSGTRVVAFTPRGTIDWSVPASSGWIGGTVNVEWHGPIVRDDGSIVTSDPAGVHAIAPDGSPLWTVMGLEGLLAAGADGTVYVSTGTSDPTTTPFPNAIVAMRADGAIAWKHGTGNGFSGVFYTHIVDGRGTVYGATPGGGIVAIGADGTELWESGAAAAPLAIDGAGTLYAIDGSGHLLMAWR
jgi:hypothetical protein